MAAVWKDLPRRLLTVTLGVPSIILLLRHPTTSFLFFQGAHLLCLVEWRALVPPAENSEETVSNRGPGKYNNDVARSTPKQASLLRAVLRKIFTFEKSKSSPLLICIFYLFCFFSLLITISPTSLLPLELLSYAIAVRLLPHFPTLQSSHPSDMTFFLTAQHYQFGLLYLSTGFHFILRISQIGGPVHIGNLLFVVWMSDTGALVLGRLMMITKTYEVKEGGESGRNQHGNFLSFIKSISPGKTLPGLLGAIITGAISALIYPITLNSSTVYLSEELCDRDATFFSTILQQRHYHFHPHSQKIILGIILSLAGIVGDLAESAVKRLSKKKDSGGMLPGHGGVVDRFDSLIVAGFFYYYFVFASN